MKDLKLKTFFFKFSMFQVKVVKSLKAPAFTGLSVLRSLNSEISGVEAVGQLQNE